MPLKFKSGTNILVYGVSGSGKTTFVLEILKQRLITDFPKKIFYFYKVKQPFMDTFHKEFTNIKVEFIEGLPNDELDNGECVAVLDDLLLENQKKASELFIFKSHHLNITVFFLTQNLYPKNDHIRLMTLNAHYMVLFADMRSQRQINSLANQLFASNKSRLTEAYNMAINTRFGFVVLNFLKEVPRELTVLTHFWDLSPSIFL